MSEYDDRANPAYPLVDLSAQTCPHCETAERYILDCLHDIADLRAHMETLERALRQILSDDVRDWGTAEDIARTALGVKL